MAMRGGTEADFNPDIASIGNGVMIAAWSSSENLGGSLTDRDISYSRSLDDGATWNGPLLLNTNAVGDADIAYSRSTDSGQNWSAPAPMNPDAAVDADDEFDAPVVTDGSQRKRNGRYDRASAAGRSGGSFEGLRAEQHGRIFIALSACPDRQPLGPSPFEICLA